MNRRIVVFGVAVSLLAIIGFIRPEVVNPEPELFNFNVTLGYIATTTQDQPKDAFLVSLAEKDINDYCVSNQIPWRFNIQVECAEGQAQKAFNLTQRFADDGVFLVGGYGWSSFLCSGARTIAKENNMTLVSVGSTSPLFTLQDNAFRLCPTDLQQVDAINAMISDFEYTSVIIIQRGDSWGDLIVEAFKNSFKGEIVHKVRYPAEAISFKTQLEEIEAIYQSYTGQSKPCVLLVTFSEAGYFLNETLDYPDLLNTTWFGTDGTADSDFIIEYGGEPLANVHLYSPAQFTDQENEWYQEINQQYKAIYMHDMQLSRANTYDCCWLMAHSIIDTNSTDPEKILTSIIDVSANHRGITGDISLDNNGDRIHGTYAIYGYFEEDEKITSELCGFYINENNEITWYRDH